MTPGSRPSPRTGLAEGVAHAAAVLGSAKSLFILTGSGMSTESGIPTFRGSEGLWKGIRPEEVATPQAFGRDPVLVWRWYAERILRQTQARPHAGHTALAQIQHAFGRHTLATQNVDLLHEKAGSRNVLHLHGRLSHARCTVCTERPRLTRPTLRTLPPPCGSCGGMLRPDIVWFGEPLPSGILEEATAGAISCDVALVVGTSNLVYPAAGLPLAAQSQGAVIIEVNPAPTALTETVDMFLEGTAREVLPALARALRAPRRPSKR